MPAKLNINNFICWFAKLFLKPLYHTRLEFNFQTEYKVSFIFLRNWKVKHSIILLLSIQIKQGYSIKKCTMKNAVKMSLLIRCFEIIFFISHDVFTKSEFCNLQFLIKTRHIKKNKKIKNSVQMLKIAQIWCSCFENFNLVALPG